MILLSTFVNHLAMKQHTYCACRIYKWCALDNYKYGGSEFKEMLTKHSGVKKRAEIQQGMEKRRAQGRDGLIGEPQKKRNGSVQEKRFENFGVFRVKNSGEGNFKILNV